MKLKHLITISLVVLLSACTHPNNDVPIQSNGDGYDNQYYQNPPTNSPITNTDAIAVGAVGVATGYVLGKQANKPRYNKSYGKPVVVVNKHYYQSSSNTTRTKYKSTYRKRK